MAYKVKRIVSVLCLVAVLFSAALLPVSGYCETLRFVFLADSRSNTRPTDPANLDEAINTPVLNAIIAQIQLLSPPPAFVIFGGDMAYRGCFTFSDNPYYIFQTFKDLFAPLTSAGIPLYTAIGNHELYDEHSSGGFVLANQTQFQQVFSENPGNGPTDYGQLVYSFPSPGGDAFFAVLDPYYLTADVATPDLGGLIDYTQLNWLATQVAQTKATHKFLFIHTPYYYVTGPDTNEPPSAANASYTELWTILDYTRFDFYACGHEHLYSRKTVDSRIAPNPQSYPPRPSWKNNVVQLLNGTCGAIPDNGTPVVDPNLWHISQAANTYYFSVVDINGRQVTVNSYEGNTGAYTVFDTFTIHNDLCAVNFLLLD
jgi:hypothetical protein